MTIKSASLTIEDVKELVQCLPLPLGIKVTNNVTQLSLFRPSTMPRNYSSPVLKLASYDVFSYLIYTYTTLRFIILLGIVLTCTLIPLITSADICLDTYTWLQAQYKYCMKMSNWGYFLAKKISRLLCKSLIRYINRFIK